ncbi:alpha/beta hydrolase [Cesiribacter sp. SM1]|uniref:alpha/beta hydrolase n=1 Tax=Cesiribacter sp. SM1 TaxID=2861196 RepID=UPI001CD3EE7E|nr:alpha/beta hydrolase [Cesiribacter sp. SM1]
MKLLKNIYTVLTAALAFSFIACEEQEGVLEPTQTSTISAIEAAARANSESYASSEVYVLVHGAWHPEESWHLVKTGLEKAGHTVVTVQLPGLGRDTTPAGEVSFADHVEVVKETILAVGQPVILVGHSYGGTVISQAGSDLAPHIKKLVYVSAFMPQDGQSQVELSAGDTESPAVPYLVFQEETLWVQEDKLVEIFYTNSLSNEDPKYDQEVANILPLLKPHPLGTMFDPIELSEGYYNLEKVYISCLGDHAITPGYQKSMYSKFPETKVITMPTADHSPFFSKPNLLINILKGL